MEEGASAEILGGRWPETVPPGNAGVAIRLPCKPLVGLSELLLPLAPKSSCGPCARRAEAGTRVGGDGEGERFAQHAASERCAREARAKRAVGVASGGTCAAGPALSNQASTRAALQRCAAPCA